MNSRPSRVGGGGDLPDLLTIEEAAAILRIGRTKAYGLARQWRATKGEVGLPVLDLGNVLRVPRHALEQLVGGKLHGPHQGGEEVGQVDVGEATVISRRDVTHPARRRPAASEDQLGLFEPPEASWS